MVTKQCSKCRRVLSVMVFGKDKRSVDGLRSWCRECVRVACRAYYHTSAGKAAKRAYQQTSSCKAYQQAYWQTPVGKVSQRRSGCNNRLRHPDQMKARNAINNVIRRGDTAPASNFSCSYCSSPANEYHHHLGYSPEHHLDVIPLCRSCHAQLKN